MTKISKPFKLLSLLLSATYFLSACGGTLPQSPTSEKALEAQADVAGFDDSDHDSNENDRESGSTSASGDS